MPVFTCERCGCLDNSAAGGTYWSRSLGLYPPPYAGELLCCVCTPVRYRDGSVNARAGRWHGLFPRRDADGREVSMAAPEPPRDATQGA